METELDPSVAVLAQLSVPDLSRIRLLQQARLATSVTRLEDLYRAVATRNERAERGANRRNAFAGLVVGAIAEEEFQARYRDAMAGQEFEFEDQIAAATETDVLVKNGYGRPAFRINIKAHGTRFEQAQKFVGMDPADTFALATYKIRDALRRSQEEMLPFLFAIVSSEALAATVIGNRLPAELREILDISTLYKGVQGQRAIENALVQYVLTSTAGETSEMVNELRHAVRSAEWRVISAQKAFDLMTKHLWDRVPAVSKRNFSGNAQSQPNMHFSLSQDMIGLDDLLERLADHGIQHVATKIAFREI